VNDRDAGALVRASANAGDAIVVRAKMDLTVAVSACPASACNGGAPPRPLACELRA